MTGTETTYYAIKLAREYTGRTLVVKFEGHFHGFNDYLAYNYWPSREGVWPALTFAVEGLPGYLQQGVIVLPFNDFERAEETLTGRGEEIACDILEPSTTTAGPFNRNRPSGAFETADNRAWSLAAFFS